MKFIKIASLSAAIGILASCGGGDSSPKPVTPQPNASPQFSSAGSATVEENTSGGFYTASASDSDGDQLSYSVSGGPDASRFSISNAGALAFTAPPNFEAPADADGDNTYQVTLSVSDGRASDTLDVTVEVTNIADAARLVRVASGLGNTFSASGLESDDLLVIGTREGQVFEFDPANDSVTDAGNLFASETYARLRLVAMAPNNGYRDRRNLMIVQLASFDGRHFVQVGSYNRNVSTWVIGQPILSEVITREQRPLVSGTAVRGPGETRYFLVNDAGEADRAQEDGILGNIVNIAPALNPCPGVSCSPKVTRTAQGVHSPAGATYLDETLFFIDRGETRFEEINRLASDATGLNFGWPFFEGRNEVRSGGVGPFTDPVLQYEREAADEPAFSAMAYYEGALPGLDGKFVLGTEDGRFFVVDPTAVEGATNDDISEIIGEFETDIGTVDRIVAITMVAGRLFVLDRDGELYRAELETL